MIQRFRLRTSALFFSACALTLGGCSSLAGLSIKPQQNKVYVVGTLHTAHLTEESYTLERFSELMRRVDPDVVLVEIPPDRHEVAWQQFLSTGEVQEERVLLYPEFTEVLYPLALEGRFGVVPCSAWTAEMAARRKALLEQWKTTRPADTKQVNAAQERAERLLESEGLAHDPALIHTARYDELVAEGLQPYAQIFGPDLGNGGWEQTNLAHYRRISQALDELAWEGRRVLVIFGAWHKYRLRELLEERDDIDLRRVSELLN